MGLSISSLLLEEKKAMLYVQEARRRAQEIIERARAEAEEMLRSAVDEGVIQKILKEFEMEARREAERVLKEYGERAARVRSVGSELIEEAAELIRREVLMVEH